MNCAPGQLLSVLVNNEQHKRTLYSVGRCTDSGKTMTLSVIVKEPGYQVGSDIGGWTCYLAVPSDTGMKHRILAKI